MRATAMVAVLLYHAGLGVSGSFLGLSQFFTLSGFLITMILLRSHDNGGVDLKSFWARRYRRLVPASLLTLVGIVVFGMTVATQQQLEQLPGSIIAALAQVANWFFVVTNQSYVALFSAPSPVQHFWSLAVEEQFYLLMPITLVLILRWTGSSKVALGFFGAGALASTAAMIAMHQHGASVDRLYYGSDTRAAELLVGVCLAIALHRWPLRVGRVTAPVAAGAGIAAVAVTVWGWHTMHLTDPVMYQGGYLVFSLVTAALIVSILAGGPVARVLGWAPLAAFGRMTYGVYLVHWPIYLWLDEDRTGLERWPLFALRAAVTMAVATLSYHFVEMPIRTGSRPILRRSLALGVLPVAACVVVGAVVVDRRDVVTDLAGLSEPASAAPAVSARGDGVLDVLVITDDVGTPVADDLVALDRGLDDLRVTVAPPFACTGIDTDQGPTCRDWSDEWPALVAEHDPDVVLFHVTEWARDQIESLSGSGDLDEQTDWAAEVLGDGLGTLTARGATVVWATWPDLAAQLRQEHDPFFRAMRRLVATRDDVRAFDFYSLDADEILPALRVHERRNLGDVPRVMVVGDSTSRTLGYGLERWGSDTGAAVVWSAGTNGCGIADEGVVNEIAGQDTPIADHCKAAVAGWPDQIAQFDPDVVVVMSSITDLQRRRLDDWPGFLQPGDADFDDYLVSEYVSAYDTLSAGGASVVWMNDPCAHTELGPLSELDDEGPLAPERVAELNDVILPRLVAERPQVRVFDIASILCPNGEFVESLGGVRSVRPDGVHFGPEGSTWFGATYGQAVLDTGLDDQQPG